MAHVLVIGASRGIGEAVCRTASERKHTVRAISRSGHLPQYLEGLVESITGNALDTNIVRRALDGVDVVVQTLGISFFDLFSKSVTLFSNSTEILLSEMKASGVNKLVAVTGFGAGDSKNAISLAEKLPFELVFRRAYDDKSRQEALIEGSGLDWLIVRPGVLTNGSASGKYRVLTESHEWRNGVVSRADVADFIVRRIEKGELGCEKPVVIQRPILP